MAKPWGRYEIGFPRHPKFLALTGNAFALWWEAKNYCDEHHTDGLFPREALRTFRFNGSKSVEVLTRSCGLKPNGDAYAPLWETLDIGGVPYYRMHDYLVHNDCRDDVLERLDDAEQRAELRKLQARKRKQAERQRRSEQIAALKTEDVTLGHAPVTQSSVTVTHQTEAEAETLALSPPPKEREGTPRRDGRSKRPIFTGQRIVVFEWFLERAEKILGAKQLDDFDIHEWFFALDAQAVAAQMVIPDRDNGAWLASQLVAEAQRRGLPMAVAEAPALGKLSQRMAQLVVNARREAQP